MAADLPPPRPAADARRPRGRPRVAEPLTQISTRIPVRAYDRLVQLAKEQETTVSGFLRRFLTSRR